MKKLLNTGKLTLCLATVALAPHLSFAAAPQDEARIWRAAITDAQSKVIRVWDLGEREEVAVLPTLAAARMHAGVSFSELTVVESATGNVRLMHLGLRQEDHGDHSHWITGKPTLGDPILQGPKPSHANANAQRVSVFFDGDGVVRSHTTGGNTQPASPSKPERATARAHHGIGVPLPDGRLLISRPAAEGSLPNGMQLLDPQGKEILSSPLCDGQHGDGRHRHLHLFGCKNGVLVFDEQRQTFDLLPYPDGATKGLVRTLISTPVQALWVGNFGKEALILIDLEKRKQTVAPLPGSLLDFNWDTDRPERAFALLQSGELLAIDTQSGAILDRRPLLQAWMPPESSSSTAAPPPKLAVAADRIAVVDPRTGLLHFLRASDLRNLDTLELGGQPAGIVLRSVNLDAD